MKKESPPLVRLITQLSAWLAKQRGLPLVVGIIFIAGGGVLEFINIWADNQMVEVVEVIFRNFGILTALIGIALLEPLGT